MNCSQFWIQMVMGRFVMKSFIMPSRRLISTTFNSLNDYGETLLEPNAMFLQSFRIVHMGETLLHLVNSGS